MYVSLTSPSIFLSLIDFHENDKNELFLPFCRSSRVHLISTVSPTSLLIGPLGVETELQNIIQNIINAIRFTYILIHEPDTVEHWLSLITRMVSSFLGFTEKKRWKQIIPLSPLGDRISSPKTLILFGGNDLLKGERASNFCHSQHISDG